ncbi:MAG: dockerin type I domain-containing protein, partial [Methanosarcinales archaeon]
LTVTDDKGATNSITDLLNIKTVKGDFNGNGRVDIGDATLVAYMVVGKVPVNMDADFNGNGRVDIGDAAKIAYYLVGKIDSL